MHVIDESKRVVLTSGYVFYASLHTTYERFGKCKAEKWWHVTIYNEFRKTLIDQDLEGDIDSVVGWLMWAADEFESEFGKCMRKPFKELDWAEIEETLAALDR